VEEKGGTPLLRKAGRARRMTNGIDNEKRHDSIWLEETASRALLVAQEDEGGVAAPSHEARRE
jgi:hypothetical protein